MKTTAELATYPGCSAIERPRFSAGLLLESEDLNASVTYTHDMLRLLARSLFGCGVVCGLQVSADLSCNGQHLTVNVKPGLALDCLGDAIYVPKTVSVSIDANCKLFPPVVWVALYYSEKSTRTRDVSCGADADSERVQTRSAQGFTLKLLAEPPQDACGCGIPAPSNTNQGGLGKCCQDGKEEPPAGAKAAVDPPGQTDPCACYESHNKSECGCECGSSGVFLAEVRLHGQTQNGPVPVAQDKRRLNRPLLVGSIDCIGKTTNSGSDGATPTPNPGGEAPVIT